MRLLIFTSLLFTFNLGAAAQSYITEQEARQIINHIASISGLSPSCNVVEDHSVKKAIAYIKNNERYIGYNPIELGKIRDSSGTAWAVVSIFAHEMAHHLLGHTLKPADVDRQDELSCDRYAGHVLYRLGANRNEALAVIPFTGSHSGSESHPPRKSREIAATNGWEEAKKQGKSRGNSDFLNDKREIPLVSLRFIRDNRTCYLLSDMMLVHYDKFGRKHIVGSGEELDDPKYPFLITIQEEEYFVSQSGALWNRTDYDAMLKIGSAVLIARSFSVDSD